MSYFLIVFLVILSAYLLLNDAKKAGIKSPWPYLLFLASIIKPEFVFPAYFVFRLVGGPFKKKPIFRTSKQRTSIDPPVHLCPKCGYESNTTFDVCPTCNNKVNLHAS